jgi:hypothetical protein
VIVAKLRDGQRVHWIYIWWRFPRVMCDGRE